MSPHDIFVAAGCQQGFLHITTALQLATNLMDAVLEAGAEQAGPILRITEAGGLNYDFRGVVEITVNNHQWSAKGRDGNIITGPHASHRFTMKWVRDEQTEKALALIRKLKEVKASESETNEPKSTS